jgi:hypothetical protein
VIVLHHLNHSRSQRVLWLLEERPRLMDFLARIHERPAYVRALERGGEFAIVG